MKIKIEHKIKEQTGLLIVPVFQDDLPELSALYPQEIQDFLSKRQSAGDFTAKKEQLLSTYIDEAKFPSKIIFVGFGEHGNYLATTARNYGGLIGKKAKKDHDQTLTLLLPKHAQNHLQELLEGILAAQYDTAKLQKKREKEKIYQLEKLTVVTASKSGDIKDAVQKSQTISDAIEYVKDLVNSPANNIDADKLALEAKKIAKENGYKLAIFNDKELKKMGWGGILSVNQGSRKQAHCAVLQYNGSKDKKEAPIILVGKGIVFDSGGYNLKAKNGILTMHQDMAGAATVLGVFSVLKKLGIKRNVVGITPIAENMINDEAYRPSDIITMLSGHTVEVTNTDAEGRLILADALTYATQLDPRLIITIATLTGASGVAVGNRYGGLLGNNDFLSEKLQKAGAEVDDEVWPLPIHNDYRDKMKSSVADFRNHDTESAGFAGASKAAAFLEKFIAGNDWCHIDIGGCAFTNDPKPYQTKGATAHGLNLLLKFLENESA